MSSINLKLLSKTLREGLLDLIFPRQDLWTEEPLEDLEGKGLYLSSESRRYLQSIREPFCGVCGFPLYGKAIRSDGCEQCHHLDPIFDSNRSVLLLNRLGRRIIHELKYRNGLYMVTDIERIVETCGGLADRVKGHILVPIPLHPRKLRERGFNQSLILAEVFDRVRGDDLTEIRELLVRKRDTDSQTLMDRKTRIENVKRAFELNSHFEGDRAKPVTLIDDVFTTGSTINECAKTLKKAGFNTIRALTFGHG